MSSQDIAAIIAEFMAHMGLKLENEVIQDGEVYLINLTGRDARVWELGHDNRLGALITVVKLIVKQKYGSEPKLVFDINFERQKRLQNLAKMARKMAEMVRVKGGEEELPPMTPAERRAVHMELKEMTGIKTESRGVEPHRRIVILGDNED